MTAVLLVYCSVCRRIIRLERAAQNPGGTYRCADGCSALRGGRIAEG
jgi:hypothetical protein